jgi:uncharacterized protein (DUF2336 family)
MSVIVERFLQWAQTATVSRRAEAASALVRAFLQSPLSPGERDDVEAAMTVLLDDPAPEVRRVIAEALAHSEQAPHHVILTLANDLTPIATLVAERSPLILDTELVDLLATRDEAVQVAIARRPFVSRAVSAALAEVGSEAACEALLTNNAARIPRFSLDRIVARFGDSPPLRSLLLERNDLPLDVRQALLAKLTAALGALAIDREWLSQERAQTMVREARESATIAAAFEAPADHMPSLVRQLIDKGEMTPSLVIRAAVSGQTLLFETALAALAAVPLERVTALVASGRRGNLMALLEKAGLPRKTHAAFAAAVDVIRAGDAARGAAGDYRRATQLIDAIVALYRKRPDRELDHILALLRRFATEAKRAAARDYAHQIREAA